MLFDVEVYGTAIVCSILGVILGVIRLRKRRNSFIPIFFAICITALATGLEISRFPPTSVSMIENVRDGLISYLIPLSMQVCLPALITYLMFRDLNPSTQMSVSWLTFNRFYIAVVLITLNTLSYPFVGLFLVCSFGGKCL